MTYRDKNIFKIALNISIYMKNIYRGDRFGFRGGGGVAQ